MSAENAGVVAKTRKRGQPGTFSLLRQTRKTLLLLEVETHAASSPKRTIHASVSAIIFPLERRGWHPKSSQRFFRGYTDFAHTTLDAGIIKLRKLSENKGKAIVLCLQQNRRTENSELNCQVCQSANGYTMGQKSPGFNQLPATTSNLVITTPRTSRIYFLLKIHKHNNPGRPIVPAYSCPTELISIL